MPIVAVDSLDTVGFYADRRPDTLPLQAFTDVSNLRFGLGGVSAIKGEAKVYSTPTVEPHFALQFRKPGEPFGWVYCGLNKIYAMKGSAEYPLTRQTASVDVDYNAVATSRWSGGTLGNVVVLNNGVDVPQSWTSLDTGTRMQDLANWPSTWRCASLRPFKNYLLALDVTESSVRYPTRLRWSHSADPGTVPNSWDSTDVTKDAGEVPIGGDFGSLIDAVPLRDSMVLYKEDSVWLLTYIGGTFIFKVTGLFQNFGMPARNCAVEFKPGQHFVFTGGDILVHDGQTSQSLLEGRAKSWLSRVDKNAISQCFVVADAQNEEVLFCYPTLAGAGYGLVHEALVWNWRLNVLSYRELRATNFIAVGFFDPAQFLDDAWDVASGTWNTDTIAWDTSATFLGTRQLLFCKTTPELSLGNSGYLSDGYGFDTRLERTGIGFPVKQGRPPDVTSVKFCRAVWPRFSGDAGQELQITIGGQLEVDQPIVWGIPVPFILGTDRKVNCTISARTFALRVESFAGTAWSLLSFDFDVQQAGGF